jgi:flagellar biosynthetic protein FlhB
MAGSGGDKTEKATPKRRDEARRKGQVARSQDLGNAVVLLSSLMALSVLGPAMWTRLQESMTHSFALVATPDVVQDEGVGPLLKGMLWDVLAVAGPIAAVCLVAGVVASLAQVGFKPSPQALKPDPKRLNPMKGAKNLFGVHFVFESAKTVVKFIVVGTIAALALFPQLGELAALVGLPPQQLLSRACHMILAIAQRAGMAYLVVAAVDYAWQRHRHEKQLKMDKEEVKQEFKQQAVSAEVRGAMKRRQMQAARARMMSDVPEADVVVTNPTHYAVALRYDPEHAAPQVVAKGQDLVAARIRAIAAEHGVPIVPDPPLARSLHATVEVGRVIPEELFAAVAQLLAFVYRTAGRRVVAG